MKHYPRPQPRRIRPKGVPAFLPVPMRPRADGWTPLRQARFLVALAATRSVLAAARKVGMARESVYRLRKAPGGESFAAAWDHVLRRVKAAWKCTDRVRIARAFGQLIKPVVWQGELRALVPKADDSALLGMLARLNREVRGTGQAGLKSHEFHPDRVCIRGNGSWPEGTSPLAVRGEGPERGSGRHGAAPPISPGRQSWRARPSQPGSVPRPTGARSHPCGP